MTRFFKFLLISMLVSSQAFPASYKSSRNPFTGKSDLVGSAIGDAIPSGTSSDVLYVASDGSLSQDSSFIWSDTNNYLDISGTNNSRGIILRESASAGSRGTYLDFVNVNNGSSDPGGMLRFYGNTNTEIGSIRSLTGTTGASGHLDFYTNNGSGDTQRFRITNSGLFEPMFSGVARMSISADGTNTDYSSLGGNNFRFIGPAESTAVTTGQIQFSQLASFQTNSSAQNAFVALTPTVNSSGTGGNTDLLINRTETGTGSGTQNLIDAQVGSTSRFAVTNAGNIIMGTAGAGLIKDTSSSNRLGWGTLTNSYTGNVISSGNINHHFTGPTQTGGAGANQTGVNLGFTINQTSTAGFTDLLINRTQTAAGTGTQLLLDAQVGGIPKFSLNNVGVVSTYNSIVTAGLGLPAIYGVGRSTAQTAAVASVATYTVGASDGSFEVSANILVTASTLHSFGATVSYTDEGNTARTLTLSFSQLTGAFVTAITNGTGVGPYEGVPLHLRCKAATAITIATSGTFTTVTYNVEGIIKQMA